ncbi:MAG: HEPN family nuclease [Deltaproteobacteria bacterium]
MKYDDTDFIRDFAKRTSHNLKVIEALEKAGCITFEVTQLVNSMLGLLVFPQQKYMKKIPKIPITDLQNQGWPIPKIIGNYKQVKDLNQLIRYLRNSIAHSNIEFKHNHKQEIDNLILWNTAKKGVNWKVEISQSDFKTITNKLIDLLTQLKSNSNQ